MDRIKIKSEYFAYFLRQFCKYQNFDNIQCFEKVKTFFLPNFFNKYGTLRHSDGAKNDVKYSFYWEKEADPNTVESA